MFGLQSLDRNARQQLLLVAIPPIILALLIAGLVYLWSWEQETARAQAIAEKDLIALRTSLSDSLTVPLRDVSGIARAPQINEALSEEDPVERRNLIASALYPLIYQNPAYYQVRWIRANGLEGVRIELERATAEIDRTPAKELQNKAQRDYHEAIMAMKPYHLYVSQPNLNREFGTIERPLRPTMRVAVRLPPTSGRDNGYLIINVSLSSILAKDSLSRETDFELYVARSNGDWVLHPQPGHAWALELDHDRRLETDFPGLWGTLEATSASLTSYRDNGRWFVAPVSLNDEYAGRLNNGSDVTLYLMLKEPASVIADRQREAALEASLTLLVLGLGTLMFLVPYSRRLRQSQELQRKTQAQAESLALKNHEIETLNKQLAERSNRAEGTARAKSAFLANMSHEIRTPMNAILGLLEMLEMSGLKDRQREQVTKIQNAARALLQILNDVLDLSKLDAGKFSIVAEPFALEAVVRQSAQLFQPGFDNKHLELDVWLDPELPWWVVGDGHRLAQVLNNLLGNALKFTTRGSVSLSVTQYSRQGDQLEVAFSVSDTGIGIPKDKQAHLFGAFEQADASTTREFGGSGLGLAICETLVEAMGGSMTVHSEVGRGTEFRFVLPYPVAADAYQAHRRLDLKKVLLVENHARTAELMTTCLDNWSVDCALAETAEDGIRHFLSAMDVQPYDAIVSEWRLGGRDGLWMLETMQNYVTELGAAPKPAVLLVSPSDESELQARLGEARTFALSPTILTKPVTPSALFNALHDHSGEVTPRAEESESGHGRFEGARVLLVEDNELNQEVALGYLKRLGVDAELATDGADAVTRVNQATYDLVLMDQHMPGMDGLEACRAIRQLFDPERLPIVAMTAAAFEDDVLRSRAAGMNDHLSKPVSLADLESALTRWLAPMSPGGPPPPPAQGEESLPSDLQSDPVLTQQVLHSFLRRYDPREGGSHDIPRDATGLRHWLHDLKGMSGTIGLYRLASLASGLEAGLKQSEKGSLSSEQRSRLQAQMVEALAQVRRWLHQVKPAKASTVPMEPLKPTLRALLDRLDQSLIPTDQQLALLEGYSVDPKVGTLIEELLGYLGEFRFDRAKPLVKKLLDLR